MKAAKRIPVMQPSFRNRLTGLPLYYQEKFQIAYTTGLTFHLHSIDDR